MTWLAALSLRNRALVGLVSLLVLGFGVAATGALKQELIPSFQIPVSSIVTPLPGAAPETVERQVTAPVEAAASTIPGVTGTSSTSSGGLSVVTAELDYDADLETVRRDLEQAVTGLADLPAGAVPQVLGGSTEDIPVVQLAASSAAAPDDLARALREQVLPRLAEIDGVRDVTLSGVAPTRLTVDLDVAALAARGLSPAAVVEALRSAGVAPPAGAVGAGGEQLPVQVGGPPTSVDDLRGLLVAVPGGPAVRLADVATLTSAPAPASGFVRNDGRPSVGIGITKEPDASSVDVSHEVGELLPELERRLGDGAALTVVFDQAPFIEQSVEDLTTEGALGLAFAVLVILVFLLSVRSTLVTAVSIPLSVLLALISLYVGGFSLNILTLGALTVAVGRVVDDSIVVIENIKRHLGRGEPRRRAVLSAVGEVAGAVTASTLTTVAVFLPIALVGGQVGELFRPFALTVTAALVASLLVSLTIVPVLASWVMRNPPAATPPTPGPVETDEPDRRGTRGEGARLQRGYLPVLRAALAHPVLTLALAVALLAGTAALVPQLETNFLDDSGQNSVVIEQELSAGTGLAATDAAARRVEEVLAAIDGVETYQVTVGASGDRPSFAPGGSTSALFFVTTDPEADQAALQEDLRARLAALSGAGRITVGGSPGSAQELAVVVHADDEATLADATAAVERAVRDTPGAADVASNLAAATPTVSVAVDRAAAAAAGLTEAQVGQAVAGALRGIPAGSAVLDGRPQDLVVRTAAAPGDLDALRALPLPGGVTLGRVATVERVTQAATITRIDGERSATVTARPADDDLGAVTADLQERLDGLVLPPGATAEIGGVSAEQDEAFGQLGLALALAVAIVYLIMVAAFRSLLQPLILLVSIPFAATGALGLLLVTGTPLGVAALIGMLMLIGIVVTNAIVLIDLVNQYRARGADATEAVLEGSRLRLRPILMTALATICALVPMALGVTGGSVFVSRPLAIVVIGGLVTSTLLTLVLVPVLYALAERLRTRLRPTAAAPAAATVADLVQARAAVPQPTEPEPEPEPGVVAGPALVGSVRRGGGEPVAGAVVALLRTDGTQVGRATTGPDGAFAVPAAAAGLHLLVCRAGDRDPAVQHVELGAGPTRHDVVVAGPAALTGVVRSPNGAGPVPATVALLDDDGTVVAVATAGTDGRYRFADLVGGTYTVTADVAGRSPATAAVVVPALGEAQRDLTLGGTGRLVGIVRTVGGRSVPDAVATVLDPAGRVVTSVRTDDDGAFTVAHLAPGRYTVTVTGPQPVTSVLTVTDGAETSARLELAAPALT